MLSQQEQEVRKLSSRLQFKLHLINIRSFTFGDSFLASQNIYKTSRSHHSSTLKSDHSSRCQATVSPTASPIASNLAAPRPYSIRLSRTPLQTFGRRTHWMDNNLLHLSWRRRLAAQPSSTPRRAPNLPISSQHHSHQHPLCLQHTQDLQLRKLCQPATSSYL